MNEVVRGTSWAAFAALFGVFAWTDLRLKKIRNRGVLAGLAFTAAAYAAMAFWTWRAEGTFYEWGWYRLALLHAGAAWAAGLGLWLLRMWPAGDAKLFMMLGTLFPLLDPQNPQLPWRAVLASLMNAFIPASMGIVAAAFVWLWRTRAVPRLEAARQAGVPALSALAGLRLKEAAAEARAKAAAALSAAAARPLRSAWGAVDWLGFFAAASVLFQLLTARFGKGQWTGLTMCAFSFFVWNGVGALLGPVRPAAAWAAVVYAALRVPGVDSAALVERTVHLALYGGAVGAGVQALAAWMRGGAGLFWAWTLVPLALGLAGPLLHVAFPVVLFAAFLGAGAAAVAVHVREDILEWHAEALEPHLVLSPHSLEVIRRDPDFYEEHFETLYADGLTHEQAVALKAWCAENKVPALTMQRTLSFAVWIFAGYAATALVKGDLLNAVLGRGA